MAGLVLEKLHKDEFRFVAIEPEDLKFPHKMVQPDDILATVKRHIDSIPPVSNPDILDDLGVSSRLSDTDASSTRSVILRLASLLMKGLLWWHFIRRN